MINESITNLGDFHLFVIFVRPWEKEIELSLKIIIPMIAMRLLCASMIDRSQGNDIGYLCF